jgi:DNA-binding beta-propeller fold protein YncE
VQPTALRRTKRARVSRAVLLPLLVAVALLASAVAAQGLPVQARAGRQLSAPAGPRPSLVRQRHAGDPFAPDRRLSGHASGPAAAAAADTTATAGPFGSFGSALVGSAAVQPGPSAVAVDRATNTIYVANGNNANGPTNPGGDTVSVIDGRRCNALDVSQCEGPWPTVTVGNLPSSLAVDQATDTVYVTIAGNNTVAVFSGATCNALVTAGCGRAPAHVRVGPGPFGIFADDANHTVYVGNPGPTFSDDTMSMINTLTCNGSDLAGCAKQKPPAVPVGVGLEDFDVSQATHTVYVGFGNGAGGVAAFDARTCNAAALSGCGHIGRLSYPQSPFVPAVSVDSSNNTIYAAGATNTIAAFDGRTCDAADLAGCAAAKPGTVTVAPPAFFEVAFWLVVDAPLHTVYVVNQKDDTLSAVSTDVCNGSHLAACARLRPPTIHTGEDPESVDVNLGTQTLYTANQVTNDVSVIDASGCNATITSGCRQPPPAITLPGPGALTADPAVATLYIATDTNTVSMINTRTCNAYRRGGCTPAPPTVTVAAGPAGIAVNRPTHTVYVASGSGTTGSVTVLDDRTCNATTTTGCKKARTLHVPGGAASAIAVNPATDTIYVTTSPASGPSTVSVFNGATCNATDGSGCGQAPHSVTVGFGASALGVNVRTDTIYVANFNDQNNTPFAGNTVSVINGTTCNATTTTGCGNASQTITLGPPYTSPDGVAIDQATDTIYVADLQNGEGSGTVSVINGAACNAATTTGCGRTPPTVRVGFGPSAISLDPASQAVVVSNIQDTSVSVIDAATCNAVVTSSCGSTQPKLPVGRAPFADAVDPAAGTIYVSNGDGTVSIVPAIR